MPFFRYSTCNYTVTLKPGLGSLNSIGTDTYRSATYDFLLTFHINHGYRFQDRWRIHLKIATKIPAHPLVFCVPPEGVPVGIGYRRWGSKTRIMGATRPRKKSSSVVWIQYTNVTEEQTDGHRATAKPRLRIASRSKNVDFADTIQKKL